MVVTMAARTPKKPDPGSETLDEIVLCRMTTTEKAALLALSKKDSRSLSAWLRLAALDKARALGAKI
jgi:hypothetical protein